MAVRKEYKFVIARPYIKTAADNAEIATDTALSLLWGDGYSGFKANIRSDLKIQQGNRCAFCRCRVSVGTSYSNLEHLVPKGAYPQFEFLPINLAYSCHKCNFGKGKKSTIAAPVTPKISQTYPTTGAGFTIVHPHFDRYEQHIDFIDDIIVAAVPGSTKGPRSIKFYRLARPELAEERAFEWKLKKQSVNKKLLNNLVSTLHSQDIIDQMIAILANMPNWVI